MCDVQKCTSHIKKGKDGLYGGKVYWNISTVQGKTSEDEA